MDNNSKNTTPTPDDKGFKVFMSGLFERIELLEKRLDKTEEENIKLLKGNIELTHKVDQLESENKTLKSQVKQLSTHVSELKKENEKLRNKIHRKNSRNSSIPPSQDPNRKRTNYSLREKSGKKVGGQERHTGHNLKMVRVPNNTITHIPQTCQKCGARLVANPKFVKRRQVIDIPPITPLVTEHQVYQRKCNCGYCNEGHFPKEVKAPVSYGSRVEALISYFSVRQYIPFKRIEETLRELFGLSISSATVCNKLEVVKDKLLKDYSWIQNQIPKSKVLGSDETECQVNGQKGWIWTWQTPSLTYLRFSSNRGEKTLLDVFPNGLPNSIVVHDSYATQFKLKCKGHQMCLPHLLRELNYFIEKGDQWSALFKQQLKAAIVLYQKNKKHPDKNFKRSRNKINKNIDQLLVGEKNGKGLLEAFKDRMRKKRNALLRFLDDPNVPHDNNGSERAIRNIKVKTKISGMFKTEIGVDQFAVIRSVIDTFIKREQPVLTSLFSKLSVGT